jgi:hypothetical protein
LLSTRTLKALLSPLLLYIWPPNPCSSFQSLFSNHRFTLTFSFTSSPYSVVRKTLPAFPHSSTVSLKYFYRLFSGRRKIFCFAFFRILHGQFLLDSTVILCIVRSRAYLPLTSHCQIYTRFPTTSPEDINHEDGSCSVRRKIGKFQHLTQLIPGTRNT